jgi:hypothetical protein
MVRLFLLKHAPSHPHPALFANTFTTHEPPIPRCSQTHADHPWTLASPCCRKFGSPAVCHLSMIVSASTLSAATLSAATLLRPASLVRCENGWPSRRATVWCACLPSRGVRWSQPPSSGATARARSAAFGTTMPCSRKVGSMSNALEQAAPTSWAIRLWTAWRRRRRWQSGRPIGAMPTSGGWRRCLRRTMQTRTRSPFGPSVPRTLASAHGAQCSSTGTRGATTSCASAVPTSTGKGRPGSSSPRRSCRSRRLYFRLRWCLHPRRLHPCRCLHLR